MPDSKKPAEEVCAVYVDMGTTNTRVWLMRDDHIVSSATAQTGIRDAARDGSNLRLRNTLRDLIARVRSEALESSSKCVPTHVAAAGMIGSSLGLAEVPHVHPPAGVKELAAAAPWLRFPDVTDLPVLLVPGVRSGAAEPNLDSVSGTDVMRGEETLCAGLIELGLVAVPAVVLNLGSHWKAIQLNEDGTIGSSVTTLSGELIHNAQQHTILASSVSREESQQLPQKWVEAGMKEQRSSGLSRALFCVRLLDLGSQGTPEDRFAYLIGAFIATDLDALIARGPLQKGIPVTLVGNPAIANAWQSALAKASVAASIITAAEAGKALLTALRIISSESLRWSPAEAAYQKAHSE